MAGPSLWLYRTLLHALLPIAAPAFWVGDRLKGKSRPPVADRLARRRPSVGSGGIWIQAVSVGEVELARRLVSELHERSPELPLLVTSTTATGLALAHRSIGGKLAIHPCPFDLPGPVRRTLDAVQPRVLVLVETELWPELIHQAGQRQIPIAVINARLSDASFARYRRVRSLLTPLLEPVSLVLARSEADVDRFAAIGVPRQRIRVSGNIKYDLDPSTEPLEWSQRVRRMAAGRPVVVAGSTMDGEERMVLDAVSSIAGSWSRLFVILAPRHPERFDAVAEQLEDRGVRYVRRSQTEQEADQADLFLLDTIGELGRAYGSASAAFIGGSLVPTGGHNPLEPAVWGVPVLTGPHVHNFREVYDEMLAERGAEMVQDADELAAALAAWLDEPATAKAAGERGLQVVQRNRGATARTVDELLRLGGLSRE